MADQNATRAGFVAIIGAPNAGKSTLVNALVGRKVSIVTPKVQTTRFQVRGVMMHGSAQLVLVDTPGVFAPRRRLDRAMVASAWEGADDADAIVHVVDAAAQLSQARRTVEDVERVIDGLKAHELKAVLVLNKIDLIKREELLDLSQKLFETGVYSDVFMISASNGDRIKDLADFLVTLMPESPYLYPEDQIADLSERMLAAEVTREKLYLRVHDELPYGLTVETDSWKDNKDGSVRIEQTVYVEREGHKPIILGKGGQTIKWVSTAARTDLEEQLDRKVHLFLFVKVRPNWGDERARFNALGLDFDA
ncbi:MAG: GTPase Era [Oceanicaulis sp.]|uniref:GTPase Era n=1 Tax=unclassified Oceanicaulis TaxID=2632123 RepID=UPI000C540F26|nr:MULTISPECIES: GTPase Era [unclassified Oceanicaulis]MBC38474.1 GTPase Era [Oceanicaulis sp.]MBG35437.1 GTPase Era [Oceanicaulis sp.]HCR95045.1 GTPase Era [Oceanicaulis sp.]|tara:strand:+ start:835 stop:1758 length:924 start_codon:yes stop_codon:yes gene_type:complete